MIRRILTTLLMILPLSAASPDVAHSYMLGIAAYTDQRYSLDAGFALHQWGYSTVGFHAALLARQDSDGDATTSAVTMSTPGSTRKMTGAAGYQLGFLADVGRGWFAVGAESLSISYKTVTITRDPGGNLASTSNTSDNGVGAYVKAGFTGEHLGVFLGGGTRSKIAVGLSWRI